MDADVDNLKNKSKHGGRRDGSGRPVGSKNKATKEQEAIEKEFKRKILESVNKLYRSQMTIAEGTSYLWRIDKDEDGKKQKPVMVTSVEEIEAYLREDYDSSVEYYYITTKDPDNRAIDSMLDRVFGKAQQSTDITSKGEKLEALVIIKNKDGNNAVSMAN